MKLNHDCVRQVLLDMEENLTLKRTHFLNAIHPDTIEIYGIDNVIYSMVQLKNAEYIEASFSVINGIDSVIYISKLTWKGHQFLDTVRDSKIWKKTKGILSRLESSPITFVSTVASSVLSDFIAGKITL